MKRTSVNPWSWSLQYGFSQGEVIEGQQRILFCAGQASMSEAGMFQHVGDMRSQFKLSLDNLESVLKKADMSFANIVRLTIYTVDVDALMQNMDLLGERFAAAGVMPAQTLLGINRLALPDLLVEVEATAVD
jgi:enamine deaminase RidA (YjgF/YER057c/UK114 family)